VQIFHGLPGGRTDGADARLQRPADRAANKIQAIEKNRTPLTLVKISQS